MKVWFPHLSHCSPIHCPEKCLSVPKVNVIFRYIRKDLQLISDNTDNCFSLPFVLCVFRPKIMPVSMDQTLALNLTKKSVLICTLWGNAKHSKHISSWLLVLTSLCSKLCGRISTSDKTKRPLWGRKTTNGSVRCGRDGRDAISERKTDTWEAF